MSSDGRVRGNAQSSGPIFFATVPLHHHSALLNIYKHGAPGQPRDALRALISEVRWIINITRRLCRNVWKGWRCNFDQLWSTHHVAKFGWIYEQKMLRRRAPERHVKKMHANILEGPAKKRYYCGRSGRYGTNCFSSALNINTASCAKLQQRSGKRNHGTLGDMPSQCGSTLYNCVSFLDS